MRLDAVSDLLATQRGVVSRRQLLTAGVTQTGIDTLLRRRDLVLLHPGTYLTHTGRPTWEERSWAAVLHSGRSALHLGSALHRPGKDPPPPGPIHVAIDWSRRVAPVNGVQVHRVRGLDGLVQWHVSPPRVRLEVAAVEVAHRAPDDLAAISALATVVGARRTVATRLGVEIERRGRLRRRDLLTDLLADLDRGTHSVLEHGYLARVLRPHGMPEPTSQQVPVGGPRGREYRDAGHVDLAGTVVELDGSLHDGSEARDDDADRDLDDLARGSATPRLRYRQVFATPCRTAARLAEIFHARGWAGTPHPCDSPACDLRGGPS
ncbi:hypothetical protein [Nocardioides okcheonensis]|uniref:hypothetical protein n=1 Tax=Nocardioides okcheonensis TaxID=2894081 RepID=UPI001E4305EB|nr:hypothetical protein [Nocardioides okcheonensis]UFN46618.1 hypothetical protein LN652_10590 [Nocardioides okcheonensis]